MRGARGGAGTRIGSPSSSTDLDPAQVGIVGTRKPSRRRRRYGSAPSLTQPANDELELGATSTTNGSQNGIAACSRSENSQRTTKARPPTRAAALRAFPREPLHAVSVETGDRIEGVIDPLERWRERRPARQAGLRRPADVRRAPVHAGPGGARRGRRRDRRCADGRSHVRPARHAVRSARDPRRGLPAGAAPRGGRRRDRRPARRRLR